jgi:hypothetical protein
MGIMSAKIVLLCEDEQMACFARRFLKRQGFSSHDLREEIAPPGKGSGEQWVRDRFPNELRARRDKQSRALFVFTDADVLTVSERISTLAKHSLKEGVLFSHPEEGVFLIVPSRNIETWLAYLRGEDVDDHTKHTKYSAESDCRDQVRVLDEMCRRRQLRQPAPPSLKLACEDFRRF